MAVDEAEMGLRLCLSMFAAMQSAAGARRTRLKMSLSFSQPKTMSRMTAAEAFLALSL